MRSTASGPSGGRMHGWRIRFRGIAGDHVAGCAQGGAPQAGRRLRRRRGGDRHGDRRRFLAEGVREHPRPRVQGPGHGVRPRGHRPRAGGDDPGDDGGRVRRGRVVPAGRRGAGGGRGAHRRDSRRPEGSRHTAQRHARRGDGVPQEICGRHRGEVPERRVPGALRRHRTSAMRSPMGAAGESIWGISSADSRRCPT